MRVRLAPAPVAAVLVAVLAVLGCSTAGTGGSAAPSSPAASAGSAPPASPTVPTVPTAPPPSAAPVPVPERGACYRLTYEQAVAPTTDQAPVGCGRPHTARTFAVGRLDAVVDGHLLAVDSGHVRDQVATACPRAFARYVGGSSADRRLSMLRSVWFTPTVAESDAGAGWYRCDVVAPSGPERLARLGGGLAGVLDRPEGRERYGMCGTAAPDAPDFRRVLCSAPHSWRAVAVVPLPSGRYPGEAAVRARGRGPCEDAGREVAADPLEFRWGYEWPTEEQWEAGQVYGRCWAPD